MKRAKRKTSTCRIIKCSRCHRLHSVRTLVDREELNCKFVSTSSLPARNDASHCTQFSTSWQPPTGRDIMDEKRTESGGVKSAKALHLQTQKTAGGASHVANIAISDTTDTATSDTDGGLAVAMVVINKGEADVGLTLPGYRNSTGGANVESDFEEKGSSGDPGGNNKKDQVRPYSRSKCAQS